ncbi:hypothetical protein SAMN06265367_102403 [Algoriphagus winogradskyi]|uniref:Uncharacterized protein n=1 Tax=Algoriphagus winogradskyi TaxID=237017 RepID=A0ABY1NQP1_9BACT|nr:hypothetical protein SAMN06265367_102403 [Algoriphagus winogradskyi]
MIEYMNWENFKLILFIIGLILSSIQLYERKKEKKKVSFLSISLVILFLALILGRFL